jgi:trans-aconitate 2-methyltransferase
MTSTWNPDQYDRFRAERQQPFFDLLALVRPRPGLRIVDLGCGTGETTRILHERLGAADTLGLDSSETMLAKSAAHAAPGLRFARGDIAEFTADHPYDVVFSNAALHWLPDHPALFARLATALASDGQLAVQMPFNFDHPSHTIAAAVAREEPFRAALRGYAIERPVLAPEAYAALLHRLGYRAQHVRLQVYAHVLPARDDVIEWVKGTLLTDYQRRLPDDLWPRFLSRYRDRLLPELADTRPYFYPFKRVLLWAQR